jgi:hypothetical protein
MTTGSTHSTAGARWVGAVGHCLLLLVVRGTSQLADVLTDLVAHTSPLGQGAKAVQSFETLQTWLGAIAVSCSAGGFVDNW